MRRSISAWQTASSRKPGVATAIGITISRYRESTVPLTKALDHGPPETDSMKAYFSATNDGLAEVTKLFDFLWPTTVALWNLRWQVQGFLQAVPSASEEALAARFASESGVHGAALRRTCVTSTWAGQQEQFASFLLGSLCATFEAWCDDIARPFNVNGKALQFPSDPADPNRGIGPALAKMRAFTSSSLQGAFRPALIKSPAYALPQLENLLRCYRYFKEVRNALMHSGGRATARTSEAYLLFAPVATPIALGLKEVPEHTPVSVGAKVKLSLRGVVGLSDALRRIMLTVDAELTETTAAEDEMKARSAAVRRRHLPADPARRRKAIVKLLAGEFGFPRPSDPDVVGQFLKRQGTLFY